MYKHILVPTDGSKLSDRAVKEATRLAEALGAKVTLLHVIPDQVWPMYAESAVVMSQYSTKQLRAESQAYADLQAALLALPDPVQAARLHARTHVLQRMAELKRRSGLFGFADMLQRLDVASDHQQHDESRTMYEDRQIGRHAHRRGLPLGETGRHGHRHASDIRGGYDERSE